MKMCLSWCARDAKKQTMLDQFKNPARYTRIAMALHWLVAVLILGNIALIWTVDSLPDSYVRPAVDTHKSIGITVLGLVLLRLLWRAAHAPPPLPVSFKPWEKASAHAAHIALYVLILAMPLSGWMHDSAWKDAARFPMQLFYTVPWPRIGFIEHLDPVLKERLHDIFGDIHKYLSYVFYGLFALHVGGALKHQFIDKEPELQRMWPVKD
jgi:cytochrome b561